MSVTAATAQIHDRGYRRYDGRRLGRMHAIRSLTRHSFQRILGLRRPARYKILPFLCVIIAYLPAAVFVGVIALIPLVVVVFALQRYIVRGLTLGAVK